MRRSAHGLPTEYVARRAIRTSPPATMERPNPNRRPALAAGPTARHPMNLAQPLAAQARAAPDHATVFDALRPWARQAE